MYKFLSKNGQAVAFGLGALLSALFLITWLTGAESLQAMAEEERPTTKIFDFGLLGAAFLVVAAAAALIVFGIIQTADNFKNSLKGIIGVVVLVAIFLIAFATSSVETTGIVAEAAEKMGTSSNTVKMIGAGLTTMIILFAVTLVALIGSEVRNFFK